MSYSVKEIFYTIQGEGYHAGAAAVFLRFTGCNLWSGREADRPRGPGSCAAWCDTDFVGGAAFPDAAAVADAVADEWGTAEDPDRRIVVCTGGEPLLQLDTGLVGALHARGFAVHVETNGTVPPPAGVDWLCVSPKAGTEVLVRSGDELKLVYLQRGLEPEAVAGWDFGRFSLQPMDGPDVAHNTAGAVAYCKSYPRWRLSVQTHKALGIR